MPLTGHIALFIINLDNMWKLIVKYALRPLLPPIEEPTLATGQEAGWTNWRTQEFLSSGWALTTFPLSSYP
jgi:hypothetical protein